MDLNMARESMFLLVELKKMVFGIMVFLLKDD